MKKAVFVGNGMLASLCAKHFLEAAPHVKLSHLFVDTAARKLGSGFEVFAKKAGIAFTEAENINSSHFVRFFSELRPDFLFSISNSQLICDEILQNVGLAINFHNGHLPKYAGFHTCTWAIFNGETEFGVTFHKIERRADAGDIAFQKRFPIPADATARELVMLCVEHGFRLFVENLGRLLDSQIAFLKQDAAARTQYFYGRLPNQGWLSFDWTARQFYDFVRAFSFAPISSPVGTPKALAFGRIFHVLKVEKTGAPAHSAPGTILCVDGAVLIHLADEMIRLVSVLDENHKPMKPFEFLDQYGIRSGTQLTSWCSVS